jgi:hypothetical protein
VTGTIQIDGVATGDLFINAYYPEAQYLPRMDRKPEPDGTFRFTGVSEGLLTIGVVANGPVIRWSTAKTIEVSAGLQAHVDIVFDRGTAVVEGRVSVEGVPLDSGILVLKRQIGDSTEKIHATPGIDGQYRFEEVGAGSLVLSVTRVDPDNPYEPVIHEVDLTVLDGQTLRQDIDLPPLD